MEIQLNGLTILFAVIISQGLFAGVVLCFAYRNQTSSRILALLLFFISLWLIDSFFRVSDMFHQNPNLYFKPIYYSFAFGPLIYLYVKRITNASFRLHTKDLIHFLPVLIQAALYWYLNFQDYSFKRWYWLELHQPYTYRLEFDGTFVSLAVYLTLSLRILRNYQRWLKDNFSELSRITLTWLRVLLLLLLILCIQWFIEVLLRELYQNYYDYNYSVILLGIFVLFIAIGGIRQISLDNIRFTNTVDPPAVKNVDEAILEKIRTRMETSQDYLNPTLSLKEFADAMDLPTRTVSEHINRGMGKTFVDFVNEYRVEAVKQKLGSPQSGMYTILALAYESGFNSKATFNRAFKKFTGKSPTEYL